MDSLVACIGGQLGAQCPLIGGPFGPLGVHLPGAGPPVQTLPKVIMDVGSGQDPETQGHESRLTAYDRKHSK
jgi:hypothetical protein